MSKKRALGQEQKMMVYDGPRLGPDWLRPLLDASFFAPCTLHGALPKNECNHFCLDCADDSVCQACTLEQHAHHRVIQVRRSSYHDVVRANDIQKLLDCSNIQTYVINSAKIIFLNARPLQRQPKLTTYSCEQCDRNLADPVRFCSIGCKVAGIRENLEDRSLNMRAKGQPVTTSTPATDSDCSESFVVKRRKRSSPTPLRDIEPRDVENSHKLSHLESFVLCSLFRESPQEDDSPASSDVTLTPPSTPPRAWTYRPLFNGKRRKGVPHRAAL